MTLNGVMAVILRYFCEFGGFRGTLRKMVEDIRKLFMTALLENLLLSLLVERILKIGQH